MILVTELAAAPILSKADPDVLALVAQTAADIQLAAGEYAVHEGDERALYVVLSGHIEVDEAVRRHRARHRQARAGADIRRDADHLRHAFQGNYRASEPARVARIEAAQFHALAASSPETADEDRPRWRASGSAA